MSVPANFIALAHRLADAARPISARYFRTPVPVDDKSDASPVTIADREAEAAMRAILGKEVPEHGVYGEEHGVERGGAERRRRWSTAFGLPRPPGAGLAWT